MLPKWKELRTSDKCSVVFMFAIVILMGIAAILMSDLAVSLALIAVAIMYASFMLRVIGDEASERRRQQRHDETIAAIKEVVEAVNHRKQD